MALTRRRFLGALAAAGAGLVTADGLILEPRSVTVTRHRLGRGSGPVLHLVQLSDLHLQEIDDHALRVAGAANELGADLVLLTGDAIDRRDRLATLGQFLDLLDPATPKVAIFGNWERWVDLEPRALAAVYESRNGRLLVNETIVHEHRGSAIRITGLDDLIEGRPDFDRATRRAGAGGSGGAASGLPHLVLEHCPAYRDRLVGPAEAPDLMLAGHTHGGQVSILGWAPVLPRGSGRYVRGWFRDARPHLYVSRGIGTVAVPVRLGSPPEVAAFEWSLPA